jgi:hypothetical protein
MDKFGPALDCSFVHACTCVCCVATERLAAQIGLSHLAAVYAFEIKASRIVCGMRIVVQLSHGVINDIFISDDKFIDVLVIIQPTCKKITNRFGGACMLIA